MRSRRAGGVEGQGQDSGGVPPLHGGQGGGPAARGAVVSEGTGASEGGGSQGVDADSGPGDASCAAAPMEEPDRRRIQKMKERYGLLLDKLPPGYASQVNVGLRSKLPFI